MAQATSSQTILSPGTTLRGRLTGEGDLLLEGAIQGETILRGTLTIGEGGVLHGGVVEASQIAVAGEVSGEIQATQRLEVFSTGVLQGRIRGGVIQIHEGARLACDFECDFELPEELQTTVSRR